MKLVNHFSEPMHVTGFVVESFHYQIKGMKETGFLYSVLVSCFVLQIDYKMCL